MAKFELRFLDCNDDAFIQTTSFDSKVRVEIWCPFQEEMNIIDLDISTAIKFSKALRTQINIAKEI